MRGTASVWTCFLLVLTAQPVFAQSRRAPPVTYFMAISALDSGALGDAQGQFEKELRGGIKTTESRWIDSICCYTMIAETAFQTGDVRAALDANTAALQLAAKFPTWLKQCRLPDVPRPPQAGQIKACPWGPSARSTLPADFPDVFMIGQGSVDQSKTAQTGGVMKPPSYFPIVGTEILRTTALSLRRRKELLGPTAASDLVASDLISAWTNQLGSGQWWEAWVNVQLGLAYAVHGNNNLAVPCLLKGASINNEFDHPLTAAALYELGRIELAKGAYGPAQAYFFEASVAAYHFLDVGMIEDSLRAGWLAHRLANAGGLYAPLPAAIAWAKKEKFHKLSTALLLLESETAIVVQNDVAASGVLGEAQSIARRTDLANSRIGAAAQRLAAQLAFRSGDVKTGDAAIGAALRFMERGSLWRLHLALIDGMASNGAISPRESVGLYAGVLRDPTQLDWMTDPLEALSYLSGADDAIRERWFEAAFLRKLPEAAVEIADTVRRERFYNSVPFGGRLTALRWTLHHPSPAPPADVQRERMDLLGGLPGYDLATQQLDVLRKQVAALGPGPLAGREMKAREDAIAAWGNLAASREVQLRSAGVDRAACSLAWPPMRGVKELDARLAPGQAILAFLATPRQTYGFLIERKRLSMWCVGPTAYVHQQVAEFLSDLGCTHATRTLDEAAFHSQAWRRSSQSLWKTLTSGVERSEFMNGIHELVVVPDGALWYVPFEALAAAREVPSSRSVAEASDRLDVLGTRVQIRYAPTVGLAVAETAAPPTTGKTVVLAGKLFPKDDASFGELLANDLLALNPHVAMLSGHERPSSPGVVNGWGRLIDYDEIAPPTGSPHDWSFLSSPSAPNGLKLSDWLNLPPEAPRQMLLPGFRTAAERGLREANPALAGMDLFLPTMGLQASGVRTLLISRWRTGGRTASDLVREFTQELPHTSPADAWQRSVMLAAETTLDPASEPRLDWKNSPAPRAAHPFLWAGYMLVDPGTPTPLATAGP